MLQRWAPSRWLAQAASASTSRRALLTTAELLLGFVTLVLLLEAGFGIVDFLQRAVPVVLPWPFLSHCADLFLHMVVIGSMLALVEQAMPGSGAPKRYLQALWFWAWYVPVAVWSAQLVREFVVRYDIDPLVSVRLVDFGLTGIWRTAGSAVLLLVGAIVMDFFLYWFHRMQHAVPLLWAFHSSHHANRSLNGVGSYHHPLEDLLRVPFMMLPLALTFEVQAPELAFVSAFIATWGFVNHMDTRLNFGAALRQVFADPWYHRVHHSLATEHYDRNFAGIFSVWDRLFGTQTLPPPQAYRLPVGLDDVPHPRGLRDYLLTPLRLLLRRGR